MIRITLNERKKLCFFSFLVFIIFINPFSIEGLDPSQDINNYLLDEWGENSGLKNLSIYNILQSSDQFLWIETFSDILRFEGKHFTPASMLTLPGSKIQPPMINSLLFEDRENSLLLEGDFNIIRYKNNQFLDSYPLESFPWDDFSMAMEDSWGNIWLGTVGGNLYQVRDKKIKDFSHGTGLPGQGISCILEDNHGNLWVSAFEDGLYKFKDGKFIRINILGIKKDEDSVNWLIEDNNGAFWIGTSNGLIQKKGSNTTWLKKENGLSNNNIHEIYQDSQRNLWVGTKKGLNRIYETNQRKFKIDHCLENEIINVIYEDQQQNLWVGTEGSGLKRLRDRFFQTIHINEDRQDYITCLYHTQSGATWVGTFYGDLVKMKDKKQVEKIKFDDFITTICEDPTRNLWIGTIKDGLFCLNPDGIIIPYNRPELKKIQTLFWDSKNRLWIGTRNGLTIYQKENFSKIKDLKGFPKDSVEFIDEDKDNNIRIGGYEGLYILKGGEIKPDNIKHLIKECSITFVYKDIDNTYWLGTGGCGLMRFKDDESLFLEDKINQSVFTINCILEDKSGYLWISSNVGICRIKRKQLNDFMNKKAEELNFNIFGISSGLKSPECTGTSYNSAFRHPNSEFWFASKKGVVTFLPERVKINKKAPKVFIEKVIINGKEIQIQQNNKPFNNISTIEFYFTTPILTSQERVFFKYQLNGYDDEWKFINPGERRILEYRNLPSGSYNLSMKACNNDGVWGKKETQFSFIVSSGIFGSKIYFIGILILILLLIIVSYIFLFKFKKKEKHKPQPLSLDTISTDKYLLKLIRLLEEKNIYRDDSVSLNSLAQQLEISTRQLSRLINEKLDKTFYDLINYYRIEEAKRLLTDETKQKNIIEIAFYVGFNSKSSFNQAFKKQTGLTPTDFKKKYSN